MKKCDKCNKHYDDSIEFCVACGSKLSSRTSTNLYQSILQLPKQAKIGIFACVIVLLVVIVYFIGEQIKFNEARQELEDYKIERYLEEQRTAVDLWDLQIESKDYERDGNYVYITGSVKNVGDNPISYFEIGVDFIDSQGNVVDSDWTNDGDELQPNESRKFEIMHKYDSSYTNYRVHIQDVN